MPGVFLDRGELERLVDAENAWHASGGAPVAPPAAAPPAGTPAPQWLRATVGEVLPQACTAQTGHGRSYDSSSGRHPKRTRSFLDDLFPVGGKVP